MSRIGKKPIDIPKDVTVTIKDNTVTVKGPKGELTDTFLPSVKIEQKDDQIVIERFDETKQSKSVHGLTRSLLGNMVEGVTEGYQKTLEIVGVGYKAEMKGANLLLTIGLSHPIYLIPPENITIQTPAPTQIVVSGIDKQTVGQVAAKIRSFRKPEPYKGKGIKYTGEYIRRKAGKTAG